MTWSDVRNHYPDEWLIVEALAAHTTADGHRELDDVAVLERCPDGATALAIYRRLHQLFPARELYFAHTARERLDIRERRWVGIRGGHATVA